MFELSSSFQNLTMKGRESRFVTAKKESARIGRELKQDLNKLEREEAKIMLQLKAQLKRCDLPKVKILSNQIAQYRKRE